MARRNRVSARRSLALPAMTGALQASAFIIYYFPFNPLRHGGGGEAEVGAGFVLVAGVMEKFVGGAETEEAARGARGGQPFGHGAAQTAQHAVFFDGGNPFEFGKDFGQQGLVQRLDGRETNDPGGD